MVCVFFDPQVGDRIVSINAQSLDGLSHGDVVTMLKNAYGSIILQVEKHTHTASMHMELIHAYTLTGQFIRYTTPFTNGFLLQTVSHVAVACYIKQACRHRGIQLLFI